MTDDLLSRAPVQSVDLGDARVAYRCVGDGPPLLLLHGWPFDATTYTALVPHLAPHFRCWLPDTPGLGVSEWTPRTDFSLPGQAATIARFADAVGIGPCPIVAHDTGATIARLLAAREPARVPKLVLLNTEMPGHRPPWIPLYRHLAALPGTAAGFAVMMRLPAFLRSGMGFGGCFHDPARIDAAFVARNVAPMVASPRRVAGSMRYLRGIDWTVIDGLTETHRRITGDVLMVWGADDPTFPVTYARELPPQFRRCAGLVEILNARFLVHEERPNEVATATLPFLL